MTRYQKLRQHIEETGRALGGVVLVDPMRTEEWPPVNESQRALLDRGIRMAGYGVQVARFGLARLATTSLLCRSGKASRAFSRAAGNADRRPHRWTCRRRRSGPA